MAQQSKVQLLLKVLLIIEADIGSRLKNDGKSPSYRNNERD